MAEGERVPQRQIITATLARVISDKEVAENTFAHIDYHAHRRLLAACSGKVCCLWDGDWNPLHRFGRTEGSIHKARLRYCKFSKDGGFLLTCGDDKKIVVWNVDERRAEAVLTGHKDTVTCLKLSKDGDKLFSSSADGVVMAWDWKTGTLLGPIARHAASIRSFDMTLDSVRLICGQNDGRVDVWNLSEERRIDCIEPDAIWDPSDQQQRTEGAIGRGWIDGTSHHTGSICAVAISPNVRIIATASNDCTCKLWDVISYSKDAATIDREKKEAAEVDGHRLLNLAMDETATEQPDPRGNELRIGAVPVVAGYHADILYTLKHEAPCYALQFTADAKTIVTGSQDATCRIWSVATGDLLFQINTPASVASLLYVESMRSLLCASGNRIIVLSVCRHSEARSLPSYWQRQQDPAEHALATRHTDDKREASTSSSPTQHIHEARLTRVSDEEYGMGRPLPPSEVDQSRTFSTDARSSAVAFARPKEIRRSDLVRFLAHGTISAAFLSAMVLQFPGVSWATLQRNMRACQFGPKALLRVLARSSFKAADLLTALSSPDNAIPMFDALKRGAPIHTEMARRGFRPLAPGDEDEDIVWVDAKPALAAPTQPAPHLPAPTPAPSISSRLPPAPLPLMRILPLGRPLQQPKTGTICKYKPSEIMRLMARQPGVANNGIIGSGQLARNAPPKHLAPLLGSQSSRGHNGGDHMNPTQQQHYNLQRVPTQDHDQLHGGDHAEDGCDTGTMATGIGAPPPSGRGVHDRTHGHVPKPPFPEPHPHEVHYIAPHDPHRADSLVPLSLQTANGGTAPKDHVTVRRQHMSHFNNKPAPGSAAFLAEQLARHEMRYEDTIAEGRIVHPPISTASNPLYERALGPLEAVYASVADMDSHAFVAATEEELRRALMSAHNPEPSLNGEDAREDASPPPQHHASPTPQKAPKPTRCVDCIRVC
eukprot:Opistho-2@27580